MESIVSFSYPEVVYKCSQNKKGRPRYGTLEQKIASGTGEKSTIGIPDGTNVENTDIRISTKYHSLVEFNLDEELIQTQLNKLVSEDTYVKWNKSQKYDIIEYEKGGFFKEHHDKKHTKNHCGTLLIFPPALGEFAHTGGELIIDKGRFCFNSSANKEWTFIAFHTHLPHECKEVLSGRRIVLKTELFCVKPVTYNNDSDYGGTTDGSLNYLLLEEEILILKLKEQKEKEIIYDCVDGHKNF